MSFKLMVSDEAKTACQDLRWKKQFKWITLRVEKDLIVLSKTLDAMADEAQLEDRACFEKLKSTLTSDQPLYIVYDFVGKCKNSGKIQHHSALISW